MCSKISGYVKRCASIKLLLFLKNALLIWVESWCILHERIVLIGYLRQGEPKSAYTPLTGVDQIMDSHLDVGGALW